jgi:thiol-disulfide isomerase/thioredoxin
MNKIRYLIAACLLFAINANAQTQALKRFTNKVNLCSNITYTSITNNETPFGDNADTITTYQSGNLSKRQLQFKFVTSYNIDIFDSKKLLMLDYKNKVYSANRNYQFSFGYFNSLPLFKLTDVIKNSSKKPRTTKLLSDTVVNNIACAHIKIFAMDSIVREKRVYDIYDIYLSKRSYLPVYAENNSSGYMEKNGVASADVFKMTIRNRYSRYKINSKKYPKITTSKIPTGFISQNEFNGTSKKTLPLLTPGTKAPEWTLNDLDDQIVSSSKMKNKVILMDFFDTNCAPCIMSIPVINRLHEKYKNTDVEFVSIDMTDTKEETLKFVNKHKMMAPVCIKGRGAGDSYHVTPIPTFYIIDKQGNIAWSVDGYGDDLEHDLITQIDKLR